MLYFIAFLTFLLIFTGVLFYTAFSNIPKIKQVEYFDYDWSDKWTALDKVARKGQDCKPGIKIHRKLGHVSAWIWMMPRSCEEGLPHTRGIDVVALPSDMDPRRFEHILDHEKIHLLQRMYPDSWAKFYRQLWDYEIYNKPPVGMDPKLVEMARGNPDTADQPWCCWRKRWWSVPVYVSRDKPTIRNTRIKWWNQDDRKTYDSAPDEWVAFFGSQIHQGDHPHEISAELLSGPLMNGAIPPDAPPAYIVLRRNWVEDFDYPTTK